MFNYELGRNSTERFFAFSLFSGLSQPILTWNEAMMVFSKFLNFFAIFLEFSIMVHVGTQLNDFSYFHSFSTFLNLFWLERKLWWYFLIFRIFFAVFFEFSITGRVRTQRNDFSYFISFLTFPNLFWPEKKLWWCFLIFWIFLLFFWNFLLQVG